MKRFWMLAVAATLSLTALAQEHVEPFPSFVQVTGTAEREVEPDEIYLSITINERDSKGKIKMVDLTSSFFKKHTSVATAQYQLKLGSAAAVAKAWRALDALGISQVHVEKVSHSKLAAFKAEVRADAMRAARSNAAALAEAIGQKIGKCFYIYDSNNGVMPTFYAANAMVKARGIEVAEDAMEAEMEAMEFQTIKLQYRVQAKFVLE